MKERLPRNYSLLTDAYELFMSDSYLMYMKRKIAVFDAFLRVVLNKDGYEINEGSE